MSNSPVTPRTVAHQTPLFMGFSRQEYCSGLSFPFPEDLSDLGIKSVSPALQADSLPLSHLGSPQMQNKVAHPNSRFSPVSALTSQRNDNHPKVTMSYVGL